MIMGLVIHSWSLWCQWKHDNLHCVCWAVNYVQFYAFDSSLVWDGEMNGLKWIFKGYSIYSHL